MKAYFISGLAAGKDIFKYIVLPERYTPIYIDWITPLPGESLNDYAIRLINKIDRTEPFLLIGLSMGGMLAVEMAKHSSPEQVIIISSIPSSAHLPGYYRKMAGIGLHQFIPIAFFQFASIIKRFFTKESPEDKKNLKEMIRHSDPVFIKWALLAVLNWENDNIPNNLIHIHGTSDGVLPGHLTNPTHFIKGGGHLMVMTRANEINEILSGILL